jgi:signal transduction histidine kinase
MAIGRAEGAREGQAADIELLARDRAGLPGPGVRAGEDAAPAAQAARDATLLELVSHDLHTPLTSAAGYLDLLLAGGVGPLTAEQAEFLGVARRNLERVLALTADWLEVGRLESGRAAVARDALDLAPVVERAVADARPRAEAKAQRLEFDAVAPTPALGDAGALRQVAANLLANAIAYTPRGGAIRVVVRPDGAAGAELRVEDTGIGMTPEDRARAFDAFFRGRLARSEPGTGLGLALVKGLVARMGGEIGVASELGRGSTFVVRLPRP